MCASLLDLQIASSSVRSWPARPAMGAGSRIDQLCSDPNAIAAGVGYSSRRYRTPHPRPICRRSAEVPLYRNDELRAITNNLRSATTPRDDVFHDAVGEVLLIEVPAQVIEGQDGNRWLVRKTRLGACPAATVDAGWLEIVERL